MSLNFGAYEQRGALALVPLTLWGSKDIYCFHAIEKSANLIREQAEKLGEILNLHQNTPKKAINSYVGLLQILWCDLNEGVCLFDEIMRLIPPVWWVIWSLVDRGLEQFCMKVITMQAYIVGILYFNLKSDYLEFLSLEERLEVEMHTYGSFYKERKRLRKGYEQVLQKPSKPVFLCKESEIFEKLQDVEEKLWLHQLVFLRLVENAFAKAEEVTKHAHMVVLKGVGAIHKEQIV